MQADLSVAHTADDNAAVERRDGSRRFRTYLQDSSSQELLTRPASYTAILGYKAQTPLSSICYRSVTQQAVQHVKVTLL